MKKKIRNIIKDNLKSEKVLSENRLDSIIREYLFERKNNEEKTKLSKKSTESLEEIVSNLNDIVEDLEIIKEKDGDTLLFENKYTDDLLETHIKDIKKKVKSLQEIINFTRNTVSGEDLNIF
jgi:uncharacterized FlaG/YvyC family protein